MKRLLKIFIYTALSSCLLLCSLSFNAAKAPTISKKSKTLSVGKSYVLRVSNISQKATWKSSKSKVAKIITKGGPKNCKVRVKAIKAGKATITAKVGKKTLKCSITVKAKPKNVDSSGGTVYITETGEKYHSLGCRYLKSSKSVSLSWAKSHGYTACSACQ